MQQITRQYYGYSVSHKKRATLF